MTRHTEADTEHPPRPPDLWELVPAADYALPQLPAARAARERWASFRRLFGRRREQDLQPARAAADLRGLAGQRLDALVGELAPEPGAEALARHLADADADGDGGVCFVIGPPRSGHLELLRCWATDAGCRWIEPPAYADIRAGGSGWLAGWPSDARCWVLPRLEHCFLRHAAGLALVRELLDRAWSGRLGRGVIGCDSWAWAYLRHAAALPTRSVLALQACDGRRLAALFRSLVSAEVHRPVRFCNAQSGKLMLAVDDEDAGAPDGENGGPGGAELQAIAAHCRGNAGLARAMWRERLRAELATDTDDDGTADQAAAATDDGDDGETVWVAPPIEEPALASGDDEEPALVLHALLLHNGLPGALLAELLPLPPFRVQVALRRLADARFIAAAPTGHWSVTAAGYAPARDLLQVQGLLLDDF